MTFSYCIKVIAAGLSWYIISVSLSWPSEIRFESHPKASAILCSSILLPSASRIETVPISSVRTTYPTAVTNLMLLAFRLLNSFRLLQRWRNVYESKNQVLSAPSFCNFCSLIIKAFQTGSNVKGLGLKSSLCLFSTTWYTLFGVLLCPFLLLREFPLCDFFLLDCWVVLFSLLSERKKSLPKCPSLWQL